MDNRSSLFVIGSLVVACSAHVDRFPGTGESASAHRFTVEIGGKGFNLATGAHRLGANVHSIFAIGEDEFGAHAEHGFTRAGFAPRHLRRVTTPTGAGIGFIDASGETSLAVYAGANLELAATDVLSVADDLVRCAAVLAQFESPDEPIATAFALARRHNITTILNPSPFREIAPEILADTSILVVNTVEAGAIAAALGVASGDHTALAEAVFAAGPQVLIVTRGADGAIAYRRDAAPLEQAAFRVQAIDSLGAGDAFLAAFAVALAEGRDFADSLREAAAAGALATLQPGVFEALATRDQLAAFLAERHDQAHSHVGAR